MIGQMKPVIVFAIAFAIRLAAVHEIESTPTFRSPLVDAYAYDQSARAIASHGPAALEVPYYQPPLYPMLLGALYRATGGSYVAPRIANALCGAATATLVYILGAALDASGAGIAGAALFALYGPVLYFEGELLPVAFILLMQTAALALAIHADRSPKPEFPLAGAGLAVGLATGARPTGILLGIALAAWWLLPFFPREARNSYGPVLSSKDRTRSLYDLAPSPLGRKTRSRALLLALACAAIPVLPFTLANLRAGETILVSWNGGINFYLGNGAHADSLTAIQPGADWERLQRAPRQAGVTTHAEESNYWVNRALQEMKQDPAAWLSSFGRKVDRLFDARETPRNTDWEAFRPSSKILSLPLPTFAVVAPLAFFACARAIGDRRVRLLLLFSLACVAFQNLAFFVADRYRTEAAPVLCVLAGAAVLDVLRRFRNPGRKLWPALAVTAVFTAFVWIDFLGERQVNETREAINRGVALRRLDRTQAARREFELAIRHSPRDPDAHRWLGEIALGEQRWNDAWNHFERSIDAAPDYVRPLLGEAQVLEKTGRGAEAENIYQRALRADPWSPDVHLNYGVWLAVQGRKEEARQMFEKGLRLVPGDPRFQRNLQRLRAGM
jgi:tetratricopeptide (TPR) repeat protein